MSIWKTEELDFACLLDKLKRNLEVILKYWNFNDSNTLDSNG